MVVNSRVSLRHLADKDPKLVALAMNEISYDALLKLASRSIENKMTTPEISDEYSKLIDINNSRKKEFSISFSVEMVMNTLPLSCALKIISTLSRRLRYRKC